MMKDGAHKEKDWKDPTNLVLFRLWGLLGGEGMENQKEL